MNSDIKANILLVDDRPENVIALEAILNKLGQNLVKAHSGEEALRCLLQQDFAVILLDVQMPGIDGFETAALIRQRERSRHTPIIFLTAFSTSNSFVAKGYEIGAVDYMLKPFDPGILTSKVAVFVDLFKKTMEVKRQAAQLATMNAELRQSEERFRLVSVCSPLGIFLTDIEGRCTYSNPSCEGICGFKIEEQDGEGWAKFIHSEESDRVLNTWKSCTHQGIEYSDEFRIKRSDGTLRWVRVRTSPMLSEHQQLIGHVGTIEDISDRKQAEANREQLIREQAARQQAEEANRMKDEFLAIVSHELRTPLNSILGWSQLLQEKKFNEVTTVKALQTIERNARAQAQLIEDILDVSKIVQGKLRISIDRVYLIQLIESVIDSLDPQAEAKAIQIETELDPSAQIVNGDPERIRQIIWNLLSNAIKFTDCEGQVKIKLSLVMGDGVPRQSQGTRVNQNDPPMTNYQLPITTQNQSEISNLKSAISYAQIQVIDTGVGIAPDFLPHVFDYFRQADSTTTRCHGGLGLGLAIVHHLVQLHNGQISAHSEGEGKGATFTVNLPLAVEPLETEFPTENNGNGYAHFPSLERVQVLVVEDNTDTRDFIAMVLEQFGAQVTAASCAREAIAYLQSYSPHVLVSDIGMPEEDGYSLIRQVRDLEQQRGEKIPALALTAYATEQDQKQALAAGFQMHLAKPIDPAELVTVVAELAGITKTINAI